MRDRIELEEVFVENEESLVTENTNAMNNYYVTDYDQDGGPIKIEFAVNHEGYERAIELAYKMNTDVWRDNEKVWPTDDCLSQDELDYRPQDEPDYYLDRCFEDRFEMEIDSF